MADQQGEAPKIVIDSDWKAQAQREREKLAEKERQAKEAAAKAPPRPTLGGSPGGARPGSSAGSAPSPMGAEQMQGLPPADFQTLIGTMVTQALMYMGAFPDPETGRAVVSLEHARFHIDLLAVLEEKTRNNLAPQEAEDIKQALGELRNRFVEIIQAIEQMKREGKLKPTGGAGMPGTGFGGGMGPMGGGGGAGGMGGITGPGM